MSQAMTWYQLSDAGMAPFKDSETDATISTSSSLPVNPYLSPPTLRGLAYGDGFFTTIGVYQGHALGRNYHHARVQSHCEALYLYLTAEQQTRLWQGVMDFAAQITHGIIKVIISRSAQSLRGYAYAPELVANKAVIWVGVLPSAPLANQLATFITASTLPHHTKVISSNDVILQQTPIVATCLTSKLACFPEPISGLKTLNRLDSVMIAGELERVKLEYSEVAEGLVKDMMGNWVEGVMSNVFYQLKTTCSKSECTANQWFTPPIESSGVQGTMRQAIIDKLAQVNQAVELRKLQDSDLTAIESMFFCNAVRGVMPVRTLIVKGQRLVLSLQPFT